MASALSGIKKDFPFTQIMRSVIMPEHVHFVIFVTEKTQFHLGSIISSFKAACTRGYTTLNEKQRSDFPPLVSVFEEGYHDRILMKSGQLERMKRYVSDNPRRRLLRMMHPEFHSRFFADTADGRKFEVYGNPFLLNDPDIEAVRISRSFSADFLRERKITWKRTVENGGVLISPFISEAERRVRDWAIDNGGRLILIEGNGFGPRFAPKGRLHDLCSEGRLLIIAPAVHTLTPPVLTRQLCLAMNDFAQYVADGGLSLRL